MKNDTSPASDELFCARPGNDHRRWENQCARCGSSTTYVDCTDCGGEGVTGHDCGEDCCCCLHPEDNVPCDICDGEGGWWQCLSSQQYCQAHPAAGREAVKRGAIEWFPIEATTRHTASDCDQEIRKVNWRTVSPQDGDLWTCSCGRKWRFVEDEAEGGFWVDAVHAIIPVRRPKDLSGRLAASLPEMGAAGGDVGGSTKHSARGGIV